MQLAKEYAENFNSITHSPYYGCTIRVISKANVSYEGILDGISIKKDRLFLKNVRVKGNIINTFKTDNSIEELDTLNSVMIDHLTNDMHIYDQVCLNVRDIQELKLVRLPSTFNESKAKLHEIDPCLVDIRLSSSDEYEHMSNESLNDDEQHNLSSNDSLTSFEDNVKSKNFQNQQLINEQMKKFHRLTINHSNSSNTLVAKKILPKKIEHSDAFRSSSDNRQINSNISKKSSTSPIRITITSKLNPDAAPFYAKQTRPMTQNSQIKFYQPTNENFSRSYQRFVPPRHMTNKKKNHIQQTNYRNYSSKIQTIAEPICRTPPIRERLSVPIQNRSHRSSNNLRSTCSLPYQDGNSNDRNQLKTNLTFNEPIGSNRGQRTVSDASSVSSSNLDIGPHSIVQLDLTSNNCQYDFEKANDEFRRYLELEELVTRRKSPLCSNVSHQDENFNQQQSHSYKKEISFFDRISCTATTGTAVAYTEMDEHEKNRQTFGDDAFINDNEWQI